VNIVVRIQREGKVQDVGRLARHGHRAGRRGGRRGALIQALIRRIRYFLLDYDCGREA
jgi:hypothetical protein